MMPRMSAARALLALSFVLPALALAQTRELADKGALLDRVAAVVNDGVVLQSELEEQMVVIAQRLKQQGLEMPPQNVLRQQVLERLIMQEVQMQRAERLGIRVGDENLNAALNDVAHAQRHAASPTCPRARGPGHRLRDLSRRRSAARSSLSDAAPARRAAADQRLPAGTGAVPREKQKSRPSDQLNEYNLSHILVAVPVSATAQQLAEASRRAKEVFAIGHARRGLRQLAVAYSDSRHDAGGRLARLAQGLAAAVRRSPTCPEAEAGRGQRAAPHAERLSTSCRLLEVRGGDQQAVVQQVHARHILLKPNELQDDSDRSSSA